ncbi:MAG: bifunctional diaminohydroxyphosphoribosylaminopyrimidine deaminase/5-amino-6-(5-phosphoribosylamino)uracil reductase RibD [Desulfobacteraceae bacterium]|jgi:diaminohydroxyphosphoribosylaminopyrimidine deaminase/5-amino-6-(5-phosphoribosylamino)uracil reductase|nr:bifunctional diaminohydroxyphosphoribosylaminopyrimidine deaminase/5-amino-6-(5-phosphoribosylamino)uracil reductase RibD [Desulfobacteraceae bacterium]
MNDQHFMQMALDLAIKGEGFTSPNPMVGAVVVKNGRLVGSGYHEVIGGAHAEVNAIDAAGKLASGATLYVTLEPCNHTGRTPPCTQKILDAGIARVVAAMLDPNENVAGGGLNYLEQHGLQVTTGVCEEQARKQNEAFITYVTTGRPFVIAKCAATLDGRIATRTGDSRWVTGEEARRFVHRLRHAVDAIMVGINTVHKDDPSLTTRLDGRKGKDPARIILDTHLSIAPDAKVLQQAAAADTILVAGKGVGRGKKSVFEKAGIRVIEAPLKHSQIDMAALMGQLGAMEISSLLIEGGSQVLASAFRAGIIDKVQFFYAPKILGGDDGIPICSGPGAELMNQSVAIKDIAVHRFGDDILIEGYVEKS